MYCYKCGLKLPEGANFCPLCGTPAYKVKTEKHETEIVKKVVPEGKVVFNGFQKPVMVQPAEKKSHDILEIQISIGGLRCDYKKKKVKELLGEPVKTETTANHPLFPGMVDTWYYPHGLMVVFCNDMIVQVIARGDSTLKTHDKVAVGMNASVLDNIYGPAKEKEGPAVFYRSSEDKSHGLKFFIKDGKIAWMACGIFA